MSKKLHGVAVSKLNIENVNGALAKLGIQPFETLNENVKALVDYFGTRNKEDLVECDNCGGVSSMDFDNCPFCGQGDTPPAGVTVREKEAPVEATVPAEEGKKGKKSKKAVAPATTTALAKVKPAKPAKVIEGELAPQGTVDDLNTSVVEINLAKGEAAKSHWRIGKLIAENHSRALWKLRLDESGKAKYKSFNSFCESELKISPAHAYNLMDIARAFTEQQVSEFGPAKLGLVLQVPPEDQPKLLEAAGSASKRELEKKVKETKERNKAEGKKPTAKEGRKDMSKAVEKSTATGKGAPKKHQSETITVASIVGTTQVQLFSGAGKKGEQPKPAKKLTEQPWGRLELQNEVEMFFRISNNAGGELVLDVVTRRIGDKLHNNV